MSILKLQEEYNQLLAREKRAEIFLDGSAPGEEKDYWQPEFLRIVNRLNELISQIGQAGYIMSDSEILGGIKID